MTNIFLYVATICVVTVTLVILIFFKRLFKILRNLPDLKTLNPLGILFGNPQSKQSSDDDYIDKTN